MDDLGPNKARLAQVAGTAKPGETMVDLGVRGGVSSFTMLEAAPECRVIGVDPAPCGFAIPPRYSYLQTDSVTAAAMIDGPLFAAFFDTLHIKEQVMAELFYYWPKIRVGGYAIFHDTEWGDKRDNYLGRDWEPPMEGVKAFFNLPCDKVDIEHYPKSWGMTFVKKLEDWTPKVDGIGKALLASKRLTEALCK